MDTKEYNFIEVYPDSFKISDEVIDYFENNKYLQKERSDSEKKNGINDSFMFLDYNPKDINTKKILNACYDSIKNCFELYCKKYKETRLDNFKNFKNYNLPDYKIQKTLPGQGFTPWHYEKGIGEVIYDQNGQILNNPANEYHRFLVYTIYLNDINEDGETDFLYQNIKIKPKKGMVCLFPADFPFVHRGIPPKKETKYIITGWLYDTVP